MSWLLVLVIFLILLGLALRLYYCPPTRWCRSQRCLVGKTVVITGANTGIGYQAALDFAKRGAKVIMACRDKARAEKAQVKIIEETDNKNVFVKIVDMGSFDSVRAFVKEMNETEDRLDILVNNAGITYGGPQKTKDGYDVVLQVNYYSHFLLTILLLGLMKKSHEPSRIINTSSIGASYALSVDIENIDEYKGDENMYFNSKLYNILFTKELARRLKNTKNSTYSVHPGTIKTEIFRSAQGLKAIFLSAVTFLFFKDIESGAQTTIYCTVEKNIEHFSGDHFDNCKRISDYRTVSKTSNDLSKLWEKTEQIVGLKDEEKIGFVL